MSLLNVIGVIVFLHFATQEWIEPELADVPGASGGDAMAWGVTALPTLLAFIVIDVMWVIYECVVYLTRKMWRLGLYFLAIPLAVVPLMWAIAVYVDNSPHGI